MIKKEDLFGLNWEKVSKKLVDFIRGYEEGVVLGLSGGLDSSTVAKLSVMALGRDRVLGLIMPSGALDEDAVRVARMLGIEYKVIDITGIVSGMVGACGLDGGLIPIGNLKARIRMALLYYHANVMGRIVVGSGNKSELLVGYFTKYGDGGVDILPLGDLYKTQVRMLAEYLGIPKDIVWKTPTAGLWPGQTDEGELGMPYERLDLILYGIHELGMKKEEVSKEFGIPRADVERVEEMVRNSEHKRSMPPIPKVQGLRG